MNQNVILLIVILVILCTFIATGGCDSLGEGDVEEFRRGGGGRGGGRRGGGRRGGWGGRRGGWGGYGGYGGRRGGWGGYGGYGGYGWPSYAGLYSSWPYNLYGYKRPIYRGPRCVASNEGSDCNPSYPIKVGTDTDNDGAKDSWQCCRKY